MNKVYRIIVLSSITITASLFTMELDGKKKLKPQLLSSAMTGKFIDNDTVIMGGFGGTISYDIKTGKETKLTTTSALNFANVRDNKLAAIGSSAIMVYDAKTDRVSERSWFVSNTCCVSDNTGNRLFVYNTGKSHLGYSEEACLLKKPVLLAFDCSCGSGITTSLIHYWSIDRNENISHIGAIAYHPHRDEIAYISGKNKITVMIVDKNLIGQKGSVTIDEVQNGYLSEQLMYSSKGSHIAVCATISHTDLELYLYDTVGQQIKWFGNYNGVAFCPKNPIIAILRPNSTVEFWNFIARRCIHVTEPLVEGRLCTSVLNSIEYSPDGKNLFIIPKFEGFRSPSCFLVSVPAAVYAYNKAKADRK